VSLFDDLLAGFRLAALHVEDSDPLLVANAMVGVAEFARDAGVDLGDVEQRRAVLFGLASAPIKEEDYTRVLVLICVIDRIGAELEGGYRG